MTIKSITKSSYINEGIDALRLAKDLKDKNIKKLKELLEINQNSIRSRETCWSQISKRYFEIEKDKIVNTPLLKLIDYSDENLNRELLYFHYLHKELLALTVIKEYIYPRLLETGTAFLLDKNDLRSAVNKYLEKYSDATKNKTLNSLIKALYDFHILRREKNEYIVDFYRPSLISVIYALYAEYTPGYDWSQRFNILNPSFSHIKEKAIFYRLFLMQPSLLRKYLENAWKKGYLQYEPVGGLDQYVLICHSLDELVEEILS